MTKIRKRQQKNQADDINEIHVEALTAQDEALLEFGKQLLTKSADVLTDFSKLMITLSTGMISIFFAILKFLGIEGAIEQVGLTMSFWAISGPSVLIASIICFIFAILPIKMNISLVDIENVRKARNNLLACKYTSTKFGVTLFVLGLVLMTVTVYLILLPK